MDKDTARRAGRALKPLVDRMRKDVTAFRKKDGSVIWTGRPLTERALQQHLTSEQSFGCCPIEAGSDMASLGAYDLDSHKGQVTWADMRIIALRLVAELAERRMGATVFRSGGGSGMHIYVLWRNPQPAWKIRRVMVDVLTACGLKSGTKGVADGEVEVFPKQDRVKSDGYGNMIILPLTRKSEVLCVELGLEGLGHDLAAVVGEDGQEWPLADDISEVGEPPAPPERDRGRVQRTSIEVSDFEAALAAIPNDGAGLGYDDWWRVITGIMDFWAYGQEGVEMAHAFSSRSSKYDPEFLDNKVLQYLSPRDGGITAGEVLKRARKEGWSEDISDMFEDLGPLEDEPPEPSARDHHEKTIQDATTLDELQGPVAAAIQSAVSLSGADLDLLVAAWRARAAALRPGLRGASPISLPAAQQALGVRSQGGGRPPSRNGSSVGALGPKPAWAEGWVFCTHQRGCLHHIEHGAVTRETFNDMHMKELSPAQLAVRLPKPLHRVLIEDWDAPVVRTTLFAPGEPDIFEDEGVRYANTFDSSRAPVATPPASTEDQRAISLLDAHFEKLFPDQREREITLAWARQVVLHPGRVIRWVLYLWSPTQGNGKDLLVDLVGAAVGYAPTKARTKDLLATHTGWAHDSVIVKIAEVKDSGREHNPMDLANEVKAFISDDRITRRDMGVDVKTVRRFANFVFLSNYLTGAPIDEQDRRYFFVEAMISEEEAAALTVAGHFKKLAAIKDQRPGLLRWWFEHHIKPHPEFDPDGRAPHTASREQAIEEGRPVLKSLILELIENREAPGVREDVIVAPQLTKVLEREIYRGGHLERRPAPARVGDTLRELGYTKAKRRPKIVAVDGVAANHCSVWVKRSAKNVRLVELAMLDEEGPLASWLKANVAVLKLVDLGVDAN